MNDLLLPIDENSINYEKDKRVDVNNLHEEWLRQPSLMGDYVKLLAQAEKSLSKTKEFVEVCRVNLSETKARLELSIRNNPEKYGLKDGIKPTEAWFTNTVLICLRQDADTVKAQEELSKAQSDLIEATVKAGYYNAGVKAMIDRKATLEHEVFLWARGYFSVPNLPRPLLEDYQDARKAEQDEKVSQVRQEVQPAEFKEFEPAQRRRRQGQ